MSYIEVNFAKKCRTLAAHLAMAMFLFCTACGDKLNPVFNKLIGTSENDSFIDKSVLIPVNAGLQDETVSKNYALNEDLNLLSVSATNFILNVGACASGFSKTHNSAVEGATLYLYKNDTNCQVSLASFTFEGKQWTPLSGLGLVGPVPATFTAPDGKSLLVSNPNQLPTTVTTNSLVKFQFERLLMGANANLAKVGTKVNRRNGTTPDYPNLRVFSAGVNLLSLTAQKFGVFELTLECSLAVTVLGQCQTSGSTAQALVGLKYMLLSNKNTAYTGTALNRNISYTNFQKAFGVTSAAWGAIVTANAVNLLPSSAGFNGGVKLQFTTDLALDLMGGDLALCVRFMDASSKNSYMMHNFTVATGPISLLELE
jgi:hypothetical protein